MTMDEIVALLDVLILHLANTSDAPDEVPPHKWAYVKGMASAEVFKLRARLAEAITVRQ